MTMTESASEPAYAASRRAGVLRVRRPGTEWLSTGWNGGRWTADCAYNVSVPDGWERTDLAAYVDERLERAGFGDDGDDGDEGNETDSVRRADGPTLLTGVDQVDARGATHGPVTAYATAGISNPAALPMDPAGDAEATGDGSESQPTDSVADETRSRPGHGTVNLFVGTTRALEAGALSNLLAVAAEAKTATLLAVAGAPGTTTDAVVVGHDPDGEPTPFSGSATEVGAATRACVREALRAALRAHYDGREESLPVSAADARYGVSTDIRATVVRPPLED
ncbi:adenosylcobinamide amidohydrolase [Natronolimnohabitans innermongolicus]|uniref:Adenosylcobinamide amidohydrolase n=1 Tax=Natronolimnohabitans innermongolicus JCM 12255 TaxID=1227499 RepID=L9WW75_9EURY|nr:adenosylcobinamide amidohydrolase [Natronolimnohabitans innermongolicus JCM 12255]